MREIEFVNLKQMASILMYCRMAGKLSEFLKYFENSENVTLYIPDEHIDCTGYQAAGAALRELDQKKKIMTVPILHSDAVSCDEKETMFFGHWNTYAFYCLKSGQIKMGYHRIEIAAAKSENGLRIRSLSIVGLLYLDAGWLEKAEELPGDLVKLDSAVEELCVKPEDYIAIRNLFNRYIWSGPAGGLRYVSADSNVGWEEARKREGVEQKQGDYCLVTASGNPLLRVEDHAAKGIFCVYYRNYSTKKSGIVELGETVGLLEADFEKTGNEWKIISMKSYNLFEMQAHAPDAAQSSKFREAIERQGRRQDPPLEVKQKTPEMLSDYFELESVLPQWTERLKRDDLPEFVDRYMKNSFYDLSICLSKSYYGYDNVLEHANRLINEQVKGHESMKKFPQFHTGNSPVIEISVDGMEAEAAWLDYGWGNIGARVFYEDDDVQRKYFPGVGIYYHKFIREHGAWRLYKFGWKPVALGLQEIEYHVNETGGWSNTDTGQLWPLPFEEFRYPDGTVTCGPEGKEKLIGKNIEGRF